ncbi:histidine triad nucleotide-binding protein [Gynuella sunshinyii]|uniref:Diadenosine tetraphosphate (Ap4A) hydrolase and other HIT family hydrolase n=1 Tax=Gynuella sunshinyii YC6258 TaxID=1445510 RepID=A0A0C5VEW8_9GAMM|nr:histidine triad nucleotide-binding protein [Gynuella sunshinyii]AJQ93112.1 diadenosine tetraphosphate (Ap4A) hydrolase and other HIT family hydrolase [Gynuella sunshinyii YC6258]
MSDCLFCKIASGDIPATIVYEDQDMVAFKDIAPKAPVHILLVPREHIESLEQAQPKHSELLARLMLKTADVAQQQGLEQGYRLITNSGPGGGQEVPHLHLHILGDVRSKDYKGF